MLQLLTVCLEHEVAQRSLKYIRKDWYKIHLLQMIVLVQNERQG